MGIFNKSSSPLSTLFPETSPYKEPDYANIFNNYAQSVLGSALFNLGNILKNSSNSLNRLNGNNLINDSLIGLNTTLIDANRTIQNNDSLNKFDWSKGISSLNNVGKNIGGNLGYTMQSVSGIGSNIQRVSELNKKIQNLSGDALKNAKLEKAGAVSSAVGIGSDLVSSFLPLKTEYNGNYGNITQTADLLYDGVMSAVASAGPYGPIIAGAMAGNKMLGKVANSLGGGTDGKTASDAILGSSFLQMTPLGLINGFGGKKANTITKDNDVFAQAGSSYTGSEHKVNSALLDSGAKYGLFSSNARKRANSRINEAKRQQNVLSGIMDYSQDRFDLANAMATINENRRAFDLLGGYNLSDIRVGKHGMNLELKEKVGKIIKTLTGGKIPFEIWVKGVNPDFINDNYDLELAYKVLPLEQLNMWKYATNQKDYNKYLNYKDKNGNHPYHLLSVAKLPNSEDYIFLKKGTEKTNPEIHWETDDYYNGKNGLKNTHDLVFEKDRYYYRKKKSVSKHENGGTLESKPIDSIIEIVKDTFIDLVDPNLISEFQNGGSFNVIPDGALHARKHNMDLEGITEKGIPVVSETENGKTEQQAEVEKEEIIFRKSVTEKLEKLLKKYDKEDATLNEKDEYALQAGQLLVKEILHNTQDNAGLL